MYRVSEQKFQSILQEKLGSSWERALVTLRNYGENLSFDVTNVLLHAAEQEKIEEVLRILEEHYQSHLQYQHPEIRGAVVRIFEHTLGLEPAS